MIVDLHVHTRERSPCSQLSLHELVARASELGLDVVAVTDHDCLWSSAELETALQREAGASPIILRGCEISCPDGHLLVYGVEGAVPGDLLRADLAAWTRRQGGAAVLPHPFRWEGFAEVSDEDAASYLRCFDAVEAWTTNHSPAEQERAWRFRERGIPLIGASDAHRPDHVGLFATRFVHPVRDERGLVEALRSGAYDAVRRVQGKYAAR